MTMLSLIYGNAFEVSSDDPITDHRSVRVYRAGGRTFIGHDTSDIAHVCDAQCAINAIDRTYTETDQGSAYIVLDPPVIDPENFPTIDVVDFDPGDDSYILCAACDTELLRDDDKFFEQYGRRIGERA